MRSTAAYSLIAVAALTLALSSGCGQNTIEGHTRPTLLSINAGQPLHADVFVSDTTLVGMGYIPEETVEVVFSNPPSQAFLDMTPDDPYGNFVFTAATIRYEVLQLLEGGGSFSTPNLPTVSIPMHLTIPVGTEMTTSLVLAPASIKLEAPIVDIMPGGTAPNGEAVVRAEIIFTGHEQGSDRDQIIEASTTILFADYADEN
ncbi:MAG: hypothetical protein R3C71_00885 [Candidatus Krumholzibacteriia bacterium]|nr:hypothetical protein [Candidatus Latescibacterota bacterium]